MPLVYRAMLRDGDKPEIGPTKKTLGVKAGNDRYDDIVPDSNGNVNPGIGGMSVVPNWRDLKPHRIPKRLRHICPEARGKDDLHCWRLGDGPFENGDVAPQLVLDVDTSVHGTIQPATVMTLDKYQAALAATQDQWTIDES